jgi:hypothetical protein
MNKLLLFSISTCLLFGLVTSDCDCCSQCSLTDTTETVEQLSGDCPTITAVSGGLSGTGYATRYWDCCKPSCSWTENAGSGNEARECDVNQNVLSSHSTQSICNGGSSSTCLSQIPFTIDGCDNVGFAFAAVPAGTNDACGKCYLLTFTGEGKYETKKNHQAIKGKKLIVMATNIGYDVSGGQFDIMIPGGGVGYYNGCASILGTNLGQQYGGLLSDCENSVGYSLSDDDMYTQRKECLVNKCNSVFSSKATAKAGCLFLANFMEAAGNPVVTYQQIQCPDVLKERY